MPVLPAKTSTHHVYGKRRGESPRPLAGPFPTAAAAKAAVDIVRLEGTQRLYINPTTETVYSGPSRPGAGPGPLNSRLGLSHLLAPSGVDT